MMKFEVRVKSDVDRRKWLHMGQFDSRIEVVREVGFSVSPREVESMDLNKWYAFRQDTQIRKVNSND